MHENVKLFAKICTVYSTQAAGLSKKFARTIGIAVDHRRRFAACLSLVTMTKIVTLRNKSVESLQLNTQRLKEFKSKMILFPINAKKPRKGDATAEEMSKAVQLAGTKVMAPKAVTKRPRAMAITADMQAFKAFQTIRQVINFVASMLPFFYMVDVLGKSIQEAARYPGKEGCRR